MAENQLLTNEGEKEIKQLFKSNVDPKGNGAVVSNITGEAIKPGFDFFEDKEHAKAAAEWIADKIEREWMNMGPQQLSDAIRRQFKLKMKPLRHFENSLFGQLIGDDKEYLGMNIQGWRETPSERIPHISFSADLDHLDNVMQKLAKKIKELPETDSKEKKE